MKNKFLLFKQIAPETTMPYRIAEIFMTSDGPRTRLCGDSFDIESSARKMIEIKEGLQR